MKPRIVLIVLLIAAGLALGITKQGRAVLAYAGLAKACSQDGCD